MKLPELIPIPTELEAQELVKEGVAVRYWNEEFEILQEVTLQGGNLGTHQHGAFAVRHEGFLRFKPKDRTMNKWECLLWAQSDLSKGWLVRCPYTSAWKDPRVVDWETHDIGLFERCKFDQAGLMGSPLKMVVEV